MGIIGGTPFIGLPGNPVASFVTFVHVVRPTMLALSGALPEPLVPMPVRAAFSLQEEDRPPRICPRHPAQGRGRRARGGQVSARGRRAAVVAGRHRRPGRTRRRGHAGRARPDGRLPVLCKPDLNRVALTMQAPLRHVRRMTTTKLDLTGLKCPLPALKTRKALKSVHAGRFPRSALHRSAVGDRHSESDPRDRRQGRDHRAQRERASCF